MSIRKQLKYWMLFLFIKVLIFFAKILPRTVLLEFYGALGTLASLIDKKTKRLMIEHLTIAYGKEKTMGEIKQMAKEAFKNIGKNFADIIRFSSAKSLAQLDKVVDIEGLEYLENAYQKGKGVICVTCHLGAFELSATNIALRNYPVMVIGKRMKDPRLNKLVEENRTSRNIENIYRGEDTIKLLRGLKKGKVVGMLIDQDTKVKSVFIDFFGKKAKTPVGAAMLALKTEATVIPMSISLGADNRQKMVFKPEIELVRTGNYEQDLVINTENFSKSLEGFIRACPTQWVWMHRRWKTRPEKEAQHVYDKVLANISDVSFAK